MEEEHSGGQTEAGTKANSETACKVDMEHCSEKEDTSSMKDPGTMVCSMARALSSSRMARNMMAPSKKTSSTEMEFSTKMTLLFMVCGRTTSCQW